jgi:hypothetical protein
MWSLDHRNDEQFDQAWFGIVHHKPPGGGRCNGGGTAVQNTWTTDRGNMSANRSTARLLV